MLRNKFTVSWISGEGELQELGWNSLSLLPWLKIVGRVPPNEEKRYENGYEGKSDGDDKTEVMECHVLPHWIFFD